MGSQICKADQIEGNSRKVCKGQGRDRNNLGIIMVQLAKVETYARLSAIWVSYLESEVCVAGLLV